MAYRQEQYVSEIVHESGVLANRRPWRREPDIGDGATIEAAEKKADILAAVHTDNDVALKTE